MDIFEEIVAQQKAGRPVVIATVVESKGSTPRGAGARMLVKEDGTTIGTVGGGAIEKLVIDEANTLMTTGGTKMVSGDLKEMGMMCGGGMSVFLEAMTPAPRLYVFGAGHVGTVVSQIGKMLGFHVIVVDNRPEVADSRRLSWADKVISGEYSELLTGLELTPNSYVVILTHRHTHDYEVLEACVQKPHRYIGMIGSKRKVKQCFETLRDKGIAQDVIDAIHSPIGIDIGGNTPAEIAVSICAQLVSVRSEDTDEKAYRCQG